MVGDDVLVKASVGDSVDDSALFRGKGNSSGGGMGRMFAAPSCSSIAGDIVNDS